MAKGETPLEAFGFAVLYRAFGGILLFFVITGLEIGFEALGVGLG